ncbi:MAG: hydroxymethylglutaryl-CoA reductase, degradative [Bacteriovoracaceae bacterium]|nr:hydroxymethylglutaryl-CoA reductase, degradative [Bacteriovoracaceae bacterium]
MEQISGFSRLSKGQKIHWLCKQMNLDLSKLLDQYKFDPSVQKILDEFTENSISNFPLPYSIAPNFLIDEKIYCVPMVIEESSVVAAASHGAKFWMTRGGFTTQILGTTKRGHLHFFYRDDFSKLNLAFEEIKPKLLDSLKPLISNMEKRGGGIKSIKLLDRTDEAPHFYQWEFDFETCDAMGANFINSVLEFCAQYLKDHLKNNFDFDIILSILTNYTPQSVVEVTAQCRMSELGSVDGCSAMEFAERMLAASQIAQVDISRAVTHNKGIMNGVDAVVMATGNDYRAVEASAHAFAARSGKYQGLSKVILEEDKFIFQMQLPLALGTVGGITGLHPLTKLSLQILKNPNAKELMSIVASVGLAQNFSAMRSLVTTGIQKGHMKMHLLNILQQLGANEKQIIAAKQYFKDRVVSFQSVREFLL